MKRRKLNIFQNPEAKDSVTRNVPTWKELHKDERTLYHAFANTVHSIRKDIRREAEDVLSRFHVSLLPEYEPEYLWVNKEQLDVNKGEFVFEDNEFQEIGNTEDFFLNTFNCFVPIENKKTILQNIINGIHITENTFLLVGKTGNLISYNLNTDKITNTTLSSFESGPTLSAESFTSIYHFIPENIKVSQVVDENGNPVKYEIKYITDPEFYETDLDLNKNGVIDEEDLKQFQDAEGISYQQVDPEIWNTKYRVMDIRNEGIISEKIINLCKRLLWTGSSQGTLLIFDKIRPYNKIYYKQIQQAEISSLYKNKGGIYPNLNNSLNSEILIKNLSTGIGLKGLQVNDQNIEIEINGNNEIHFLKSENLVTVREKLNFSDMDQFIPIHISLSDDVLYILTSNKTSYRIYICDTKKEGVEYTDQFFNISFPGMPIFIDVLEPSNILTVGTIVSNSLYFYKYKLDKKFFFVDNINKEIYVSKQTSVKLVLQADASDEVQETSVNLIPRKVQNSVDDFGFNWGVYRIPGETNKEMIARLKDYFKHLQGNNLQGMYYGIAKELNIKDLNTYRLPESKNIIIRYGWREETPLRILIADDINQELHLYGFKKIEKETIDNKEKTTVSELYKIDSSSIEIPESLSEYQRNFIELSWDSESFEINQNRFIFKTEEIASLEEEAIYQEGILSFTKFNYLKKYSDFRAFIYYDTIDGFGQTHSNFYEEFKMPFFENLEPKKFTIEDLLHEGKYRNENIDDKNQREILIKELRNQDDSRWEHTVNEVSYFNIRPFSSQNLKPSIWNGFSFKKHFNSLDWRI